MQHTQKRDEMNIYFFVHRKAHWPECDLLFWREKRRWRWTWCYYRIFFSITPRWASQIHKPKKKKDYYKRWAQNVFMERLFLFFLVKRENVERLWLLLLFFLERRSVCVCSTHEWVMMNLMLLLQKKFFFFGGRRGTEEPFLFLLSPLIIWIHTFLTFHRDKCFPLGKNGGNQALTFFFLKGFSSPGKSGLWHVKPGVHTFQSQRSTWDPWCLLAPLLNLI